MKTFFCSVVTCLMLWSAPTLAATIPIPVGQSNAILLNFDFTAPSTYGLGAFALALPPYGYVSLGMDESTFSESLTQFDLYGGLNGTDYRGPTTFSFLIGNLSSSGAADGMFSIGIYATSSTPEGSINLDTTFGEAGGGIGIPRAIAPASVGIFAVPEPDTRVLLIAGLTVLSVRRTFAVRARRLVCQAFA